MNAILDKFIATAEGELPPEQLQQIQDQFGEKAVSQAKRMARQKWRQDEVMRVIETDEGIDIQHETPIRLTPEAVEVDDYQQTVVDLCGKASAAGVSAATINRCLRIVAIRGEEYRSLGPMGVAHFFYHLQPCAKDCLLESDPSTELSAMRSIFPVVDLTQLNLYAMWPPPVFLWHMPPDLIFDLLFRRIVVFAQIDLGLLFEFARSKGIEMRWATGKEDIEYKKVTKVIPGSPNAFGIKATLINDANASEQTLFVGFLSRMLLGFMAPKQWLKLVHAG